MRYGMGGFKSRDDTLGLRQGAEGGNSFVVRGKLVFDTARIPKIAVLRADRGVIEPGRNGMGELDLAVVIGEKKCFRPLQNAQPAALKARCMFPGKNSFAAGFDA